MQFKITGSAVAALRQLIDFVWANVGHCTTCMRQAFLATFGSWMLAVFARAISAPTSISVLIAVAALGLTLLWIVHLIAFAAKATHWTFSSERHDRSDIKDGPTPVGEVAPTRSRREMLSFFARTVAGVAIGTAVPAAFSSAFGKGLSPCRNCRGCWNCCTCYQQACTASPTCDIKCVNKCNGEYKRCINKC